MIGSSIENPSVHNLSVPEVVELVDETLNEAASGRVPGRIAGDEIEVGSIISCHFVSSTGDIEIEINGRYYRLLISDVTDEISAHQRAREQRHD
jgi:hypothetical protein